MSIVTEILQPAQEYKAPLADMVDVIHTGGVVFLMAARRKDRNFAKQQILAMVGPAGGVT